MHIVSNDLDPSEYDYPTDLSHPSVSDDVSLLVCWIEMDFTRVADGNVAHHGYNALVTLTHFACWTPGGKQRPITSDERDTLCASFEQAEPHVRDALAAHIDAAFLYLSLGAIRSLIECWSMTSEERFAVSSDSRKDTMDGVLLARNALHNALLVGDVTSRATTRILNGIKKFDGLQVGQ